MSDTDLNPLFLKIDDFIEVERIGKTFHARDYITNLIGIGQTSIEAKQNLKLAIHAHTQKLLQEVELKNKISEQFVKFTGESE